MMKFNLILWLKKYFFLLVIICFNGHIGAQTINLGGSNWITGIPSTTISEAGNDYVYNDVASPYESVNNQIILTGNVPSGLVLIPSISTISTSLTASNFPPTLTISLRRSASSTCTNCSIDNNSATYKDVTLNSNNSFSVILTNYSLGSRAYNIPIQIKINGISVLVPSGSYQANITFTISSN